MGQRKESISTTEIAEDTEESKSIINVRSIYYHSAKSVRSVSSVANHMSLCEPLRSLSVLCVKDSPSHLSDYSLACGARIVPHLVRIVCSCVMRQSRSALDIATEAGYHCRNARTLSAGRMMAMCETSRPS